MKRRLRFAGFSALLLAACSGTRHTGIRIDDSCDGTPSIEARYRVVLRRGTCEAPGDVVFEAEVGAEVPAMDVAPGHYAAEATAADGAGTIWARGCREVDLPLEEGVDLVLALTPTDPSFCADGMDAGLDDAGIDGGIDGGPDPIDAGADAGPACAPLDPTVGPSDGGVIVWHREVDYDSSGMTVNPDFDAFGNRVWGYDSFTGDAWYHGPTTPMVYDPDYPFGSTGRWVRAGNLHPSIRRDMLEYTIDDPTYAPVVRFVNPFASSLCVRAAGSVDLVWATEQPAGVSVDVFVGVDRTPAVDLVSARLAGPAVADTHVTLPLAADPPFLLAPGEAILFTLHTGSSGTGRIAIQDGNARIEVLPCDACRP
ncbi:MAG: hypothetical protein KC619_26540 [Myxococcales bacterium]|nr:hypothetical protein [Myxococcales bacterium]